MFFTTALAIPALLVSVGRVAAAESFGRIGTGPGSIQVYKGKGMDDYVRSDDNPKNASLLILSGVPGPPNWDCLGSEGMGSPKKVDVPADVCLYGTFTNTSIVLVDGTICPDGSLPYMAIYSEPLCHGTAAFFQWQYGEPGSLCYSQSPWWNNTHLIQQYSVIFRCEDVPQESLPKKFMNGDDADPIVVDAHDRAKRPGACHGSSKSHYDWRSMGTWHVSGPFVALFLVSSLLFVWRRRYNSFDGVMRHGQVGHQKQATGN